MKKRIKYFLKNSDFVFNCVVWMLFLYLKFAYLTSKWHFVYQNGAPNSQTKEPMLFAMWHNNLAFGMGIFNGFSNMYALASPHSDGKIIAALVVKMGYKVVHGSSNKNPSAALKNIINLLTNQRGKIVITPDGPRGPKYHNNSAITKIAHKYNKKLIPISCFADKFFQLKTWDQMLLPKPFSKIRVIIGSPIDLSGNEAEDKKRLEEVLMAML